MAFSKVMIIGNLGRDPEMRYTPNGRAVTEFSVAVTHSARDPQTGEWADESTDWFRVTVWAHTLGSRTLRSVGGAAKWPSGRTSA